MCPSKPKIQKAPPIPDPAPPVEATAVAIKRDSGSKHKSPTATQRRGRSAASDLRVDLSIPGAGGGLQV